MSIVNMHDQHHNMELGLESQFNHKGWGGDEYLKFGV